jgi:hypothetical protein
LDLTHEFGHRDVIRMSNSFPFQNLRNRQAENSEVEPEALMIDIPEVQC